MLDCRIPDEGLLLNRIFEYTCMLSNFSGCTEIGFGGETMVIEQSWIIALSVYYARCLNTFLLTLVDTAT
jgi:hypothetical protein